MEKKIIRKIILNNRKGITKNSWKMKSYLINKKIIQTVNFGNKKIAIYFPINNELFLHDLFYLTQNKIFLPKIQNNSMQFYEYLPINRINSSEFKNNPKRYNLIFENKTFSPKIKKNPINPEIIFIPLVAFNANCYRIGYGGGFYDKYLKNKSILKIGVAFEMQKIDFTAEHHDVQLDYIFTESKIYRKHSNGQFALK